MKDHTDRQKACSEVAVALEQQRALHIVAEVRKQGFAKSANGIPTQAEAAFDLACEEIDHRLRTEVWELNGVASPITAFSEPAGAGDVRGDAIQAMLKALHMAEKKLLELEHAVGGGDDEINVEVEILTIRDACKAFPAPSQSAAPADETADLVLQWRDGEPPKVYRDEWFIAETTFGDRVVLTALPEEYTYDYKTADETYIKADKIKRWMQFPDSQYIAPTDAGAAQATAAHAGATWKLVPVEPTETMVTAANEVEYCEDGITHGQLRAAINAAPTPSAAAPAALTDERMDLERTMWAIRNKNREIGEEGVHQHLRDSFDDGFKSARALIAAAKPVSILNPVDVDLACVQVVDEEFFNLLTNSDDFHKAAMTYRVASVGEAPAAYEALVRAAKPVSVDAGGVTDTNAEKEVAYARISEHYCVNEDDFGMGWHAAIKWQSARASMPERKAALTDEQRQALFSANNALEKLGWTHPKQFISQLLATPAIDSTTPNETGEAE